MGSPRSRSAWVRPCLLYTSQDFVGSLLEKYEGLDQSTAPQVAAILNEMRRDALNLSPLSRARMLSLRLSANDLLRICLLYTSRCV